MARTDDIAHRLSVRLAEELSDFKYAKSRAEFKRTQGDIADALLIDVNTRDGASYALAFRIGVVHTAVEKLVAEIEGRKTSPYDRTIAQYSPNVGKQNVLPFNGKVWWWGISPETDFSDIFDEILSFVRDFGDSYFERFHDLLIARDSLETRDGLSLNAFPFKQVLAIDAMLADRAHIEHYLPLLQTEVDGGYHHDHHQFNAYYEALRVRREELFPEFILHPKQRHNKS
jgi:hypothetical protein